MKKLAWITVGLTYFLMFWGNVVSSTGSGLACPDWPLCHGTITPTLSADIVLEWGHRIIAFTTSLFILATLYFVFTNKDQAQENLKRSGRTLLVLLGFQILLGGLTVLLGLSVWVSTIHLLIATFVFSGLITVACVTTWNNPVIEPASPKIQRLAVAGLGALLVQFVLGALVRHNHSGLACPNFPGCLDGFLPIPLNFETAIAFTHRWWGFLMLGLFGHLSFAAPKLSPRLTPLTRQLFALSIAQVILGIGTVLSGLHTHSRAIHAALGYALWGILFFTAIRAGALRGIWQSKART